MARTVEMEISTTYSFDNNIIRLPILAPSTFRIPISLILKVVENETNAKSPIQAITIASIVKAKNKCPNRK